MPSPPFREGAGIGLIILKDMKKVYVAPQSEIVKLIGKEHTMQYVNPFGGINAGSATPPSDMI